MTAPIRLLFLLLVPCLTTVAGAVERPNLMVFLIDDMGVMDTSVPFLTGPDGEPQKHPLNEWYRTPSMERLAAQGIRFNQFYAMSVCSPTRISILTGQNAARHGATNWIRPSGNNRGEFGPPNWDWEGLAKGDFTLPGILSQAGYRTIHVGKAHFGPDDHEGSEPLNLGFQHNVGGASFGAPGSYYGKDNYGWGTKRESHAVPHLEAYHGTDVYLSEALTIEAKKQVDASVREGKPFFLHFAHYAVHSPFQSDPRFAGNYADSDKPGSAKAFATMVEGMDKSLGDMIDHLEAAGVAEKTLIIFLGDNGTDAPLGHQHEVACAAPLRGKKGSHYEGGMRVPFIAAWARPSTDETMQKNLPIPAGAVQSQVANVCDLLPTLVELAGARLPAGHVVDGLPLQTLLEGKADPTRPEQFLMHYPHGPHRSSYFTVWRNGEWKVIYHAVPKAKATGNRSQSGGAAHQLFHLATDPHEQGDLAGKKPEVLERMMKELAAQLEKHGALHPVSKNGEAIKP